MSVSGSERAGCIPAIATQKLIFLDVSPTANIAAVRGSRPDRRKPTIVHAGAGLEPGSNSTVPTTSSAPMLTEAVSAITTLGSRASGGAGGLIGPVYAIAIYVDVRIRTACLGGTR